MRVGVGTSLGPDEILDAIGAGGMGQVFKARDRRLGRIVAVKVLSDRFAEDPERKQRFDRQAQAIASLNHPNICVVHDVGEDGGTS
jgi:eukaryotic-like serine/threonine-protein kinase